MGLSRLLENIIVPAAIGAGGALVAKSLGYDISVVEGMRQAVMAGLPIAAITNPLGSNDKKEFCEFGANNPYFAPLFLGACGAGAYLLGGIGIEYLTKTADISQKFTTAVGGLYGVLDGVYYSIKGRSN